ncbi:MAG: transcription elongation factor Spt5 [Candidatus Methanomethylophilaceae archaeon]|nr:transcription elongation factor Spt5 [Candidatus Methanomethylophilaceae archaeon]
MSVSMTGESNIKKVAAGAKVEWPFQISSDSSSVKLSFSITMGPDPDNAPEWNVTLYDSTGEIWNNYGNRSEVTVDIPGKSPKQLTLEVICPTGARYADSVITEVTAEDASMRFQAVAQQSIMVLKTQIDQEKSVAESLFAKSKFGEKDLYAILSPTGLRGYVFVEGMNTDRLHERAKDIKKARNFVPGETSIDEISQYLTPMSAVEGIVEGDIVELVNGPFKGEKARVQQIDHGKEEITVELIEAMVPIPVTVKGDSVRVIEKEK